MICRYEYCQQPFWFGLFTPFCLLPTWFSFISVQKNVPSSGLKLAETTAVIIIMLYFHTTSNFWTKYTQTQTSRCELTVGPRSKNVAIQVIS